MKKLLLYFSLLAFIIIMLVGDFSNSKNSITGIYLKAINGSNLIIDNHNGPIVMGNETGKESIFDDLKSGDKIEITCDSILETYPARTQIYSCKLIERGNINDIPKDIVDRLQEMGRSFDLSN